MSAFNGDAENFAEALALIAARVPAAMSVFLTITGEHGSGFMLSDVRTADGDLSDTDEDLLGSLQDETEEFLNSLGWRGVVREDKRGDAHVTMTGEKIPLA